MNSEQYNPQEQMEAEKIDVNVSELFRLNKTAKATSMILEMFKKNELKKYVFYKDE